MKRYKTGAALSIGVTLRALTLAICLTSHTQAGLTTYYRMDEGSGDVLHDAVGSSDAALFGGVTWTAGRIGAAIHLNGQTQYGRAPTFPIPTTTETVSAWAWQVGPPSNWASIVKNWGSSKQGAFHLGLDWLTPAGGKMGAYVSDATRGQVGPSLDTQAFPIGSWVQVGMVANGSTFAFYRNGERVGSAVSYGGSLRSQTPSLGIGVKLGDDTVLPDRNYPGFWSGKIDDLGIYDTALSPVQMRAVYQLGNQPALDDMHFSGHYGLGEDNLLFDAFLSASSVQIGNDSWAYVTGLNSRKGAHRDGELFASDGRLYFSLSSALGGAGMVAVPEPPGAALATLGFLLFCARLFIKSRESTQVVEFAPGRA